MLRPSTHSHDSTPQPGGSMLSDLQAFLTIIVILKIMKPLNNT